MDRTAAHSVEITSCPDGELCTSGRAGHRLLPIQERVIAASPSAWRDAIVSGSGVSGSGQDGWVEITFVAHNRRAWVWQHSQPPAPGEPVAYHPAAGALAVSGTVVSVLAS